MLLSEYTDVQQDWHLQIVHIYCKCFDKYIYINSAHINALINTFI